MITSKNIHIWNSQNPFTPGRLLADTPEGLRDFASKDDAVNGLYLLGYKQSARELHHASAV